MFARALLLIALLSGCASTSIVSPADDGMPSVTSFAETCKPWDDWEKPALPFRVYGNTYYVGTCGIASILIVGVDSNAVIDAGTETGADEILANLRRLGIVGSDIEILLASHEHFDHVGGMAKLQQATGATVIASDIAIEVMKSGLAHPSDPQAGMHDPMQAIGYGKPFDHSNAPYKLSKFTLTPIETPGHTPGAMSWQWESCEDEVCKTIVYADSMSAISRDGYRFSDHPEYVAAFREGIERIAAADCDILLTPHPSASFMLQRAATGSMVGGTSCAEYAAATTRRLDARLASEAGGE